MGYTTGDKAVAFDSADFSLTATGLVALVNVGDEVGYGSGGNAGTVAPTTGVMTKSMVVASTDGQDKVIGTDRTIALASTTNSNDAPVQIINRLNDRDKRAALQVTLNTDADVGKIVSNIFYCTVSNDASVIPCSGFKINDLIRVQSVMKNGQNQPAMDGIHVVTAIPVAGKQLTLSAAIGSTADSGDLSASRTQVVLTRLNTFPCSVEETRKGTSESLECSGRGLCDGSSGECACF